MRKKGCGWHLFTMSAVLLALYVISLIVFELDYNTRCVRLLEQGEYTRAVEVCTQAIERDSQYAEAYVNRGNAQVELGSTDAAMADFNQAILLRPELALAYSNRCGLWLILDETSRAQEDCSRAINLAPQEPLPYANRGNVWMELGEWEQAMADYNKSLELMPAIGRTQVLYVYRSNAKRLSGDLDGAIADCEQAIQKDSNFAPAYLCRGLALLLQGETDQAQTNFDRFLELRPNYGVYLELELLSAELGVVPSKEEIYQILHSQNTIDSLVSQPNATGTPIIEQTEEEGVIADSPSQAESQPSTQTTQSSDENFLTRRLPLYVTLIAGLALLFIFTGLWLVLRDLEELAANVNLPHELRVSLAQYSRQIKFRRITALVFGVLLIISYLQNMQVPTFYGLILLAFFLDSLSKAGDARKVVNRIREA